MEKMAIEDVKNKYENQLLDKKGVVGVGIGETVNGEKCIKVYVIEKITEVETEIPKELECYKVEIEEVGEIRAL